MSYLMIGCVVAFVSMAKDFNQIQFILGGQDDKRAVGITLATTIVVLTVFWPVVVAAEIFNLQK